LIETPAGHSTLRQILVLARALREAIHLPAVPTGIRQCEGASCAIAFLDTSRKGDRRWCSMAGCGNKAKVAGFRRRKRGDAARASH
jgi:hypothetical protein